MKFTTALFSAIVLAISASSLPIKKRDVPADLVPQFGFSAGVNPTGTGNCDGAVDDASGKPVQIPCSCPPDRQTFIDSLNANVAAGHAIHNPSVAVEFPLDDSKASQLARINAALVTLQNLNGTGVGCPAASTTFLAQQKAIQDGQASSTSSSSDNNASSGSASAAASDASPTTAEVASATASAPAASASASASSTAGINATIAAVAPSLGFTAGKNPTGSGSCDGAVNGANGQPVLIPCSCPPDSNTYLAALSANVAAGRAIHNPTVAVTYPLDDSVESKQARITAASITLQNLVGPGVGCPIASTTLQAQSKALSS